MDKNTLQVLLVEDNLTDVLLLEEALEEGRVSEHTLTHVKRLDEALQHLHEKGFDVALLDLGLPDSQGFETFVRLQREHPTIPILILSGLDDEALAVRAVQEGAQDFVVKGNLKDHRMGRTIRYAIERKRAEQRLMTSEVGYRRLFETAQDGIFVLDAETGQITEANPFLETLLGYTTTEFIGKRLWEIAPFRDKAANQAAFRTLQEKGHIHYENLPLMTRAGKQVDVEFISNVYAVDTKRVIQCNIRDITERKQAEMRLRASEASLAVAQQMAHLGSWELDLSNLNDINANTLRWSEELFRILGYEPADFEPSNDAFFRAVHPDDRGMLSLMMAEAVRGGSPYSVDHRIILPDGRERIVHAEAEIIYGESGRPLKVVGLGQDITEQERIKQQLQTHSHLLNVIGQAVVVTDLAGIVTYWNHFAETLYGWSSAEAQGRSVLDLIVNDTTQQQAAKIMECLMQGKSWSGEFIVQKRDGTSFPAYVTDTPVLDESGHVVGVIGLSLDITERKQVEEALGRGEREQRELAQQLEKEKHRLVEAQAVAKVGSWELDISASVLNWSDENYRIFGIDRSKFGATYEAFLERIHPDDRTVVNQAYTDSVTNRTAYAIDHRLQMDDGSIKFIHERCNTFYDDAGRPIRSVGTSQDITERKQAEAQLIFQKTLLEAQSEASPDGILLVSEEGKLLSYNQRYVQMWGISAEVVASGDNEQFRQTVLNQVVNPQQALESALHLYTHRDERSHEEVPLLDGRVFTRDSAPITSTSGAYYGRVWYFRDITDQKRIETLLRGNRKRLALATESAQIGIWDWDVVANRMVWDAQMIALYGISRADFSGAVTVWEKGLHPEDRDRAEAELNAALNGDRDFHTQFRVVWPSGEVRHIEAHAVVQKASDGSPLRMVGVNWDITERKRAEDERDRFFTLSVDMMAIAGLDGYFKRVSPAFSEVLGFTEAEMLATPFLERVHPDDLAATQAAVEVLAQGNPIVGFENRYRTNQGDWRLLEWRSAAVPETGLIYAVARDVTHRKEAETALLQMRDELEVRVQERTADLEQANYTLLVEIMERQDAEAETQARVRQQEAVAELGQRALTDIDTDTLLNNAAALVTATLDVEISCVIELMPDGDTLRFRAGSGWKTEVVGRTVPRNSQAGYALANKAPTSVFNPFSSRKTAAG